jgi:hypothetical protein
MDMRMPEDLKIQQGWTATVRQRGKAALVTGSLVQGIMGRNMIHCGKPQVERPSVICHGQFNEKF